MLAHSVCHRVRQRVQCALVNSRSYISVEDFFEEDDEEVFHIKRTDNLPTTTVVKGKHVSPFSQTKKSIGGVLGWLITKKIVQIPIPNADNSFEIIPTLISDSDALRCTKKMHVTWFHFAMKCQWNESFYPCM